MALVVDGNDPNGQGMFSRAGRITSAKYVVFQKRVEILNNQRKFIKVSSLPFMNLEAYQQQEAHNKPLFEDEEHFETKAKETHRENKRPETAPFTRQLSRETVHRVQSGKRIAPPTGFYNPKFTSVEKTQGVLFQYDKERPRPQSSCRPNTSISAEDASRILPDKLPRKVNGPVPLAIQTTREHYTQPGNNPHEERFTLKKEPLFFSKMRRTPSVDMRKTSGREAWQPAERPLPDYNPNFEVGKRQGGSCGPPFNKTMSRKGFEYKSYCANQEFFNLNKSLVLKFKKSKIMDFGKSMAREWDASHPLPSFMQKGNASRHSVGQTSQKTLEINNFSEGKFQSVISGFSPFATSRVDCKSASATWRSYR